MVTFKDPTNAERAINLELAGAARVPAAARAREAGGEVQSAAVRGGAETRSARRWPDWRELLAHVKSEGMREVSIQRYKGLGEMNAEQLWETTMNAETRTLLKVSLEDLVQSDEIFTTLMGEDVESRRKFIEENALDVRNLDV